MVYCAYPALKTSSSIKETQQRDGSRLIWHREEDIMKLK